jgi:putative membrane protein
LETVIFCIDRDNDFGEKLGLKGPIVGRRDNLKAAIAMGLADPEESDMNALFSALKMFDELKGAGKDVEIVTLLGSTFVGYRSDLELGKSLETFLRDHHPRSAIVVSDGAEDEQVLPIIQSRIPVDHVQRVIVKQSETAESTYYVLKRAFEEEDLGRRIFVPISLILIVYTLFAFTDYASWAKYAIGLAFGIYMFLYFINAGEAVSDWYSRAKVSIVTSQISFFGKVMASIIVLVGALFSFDRTEAAAGWVEPWEGALVFMGWFVWFAVGAALINTLFGFLDAFILRRRIQWSNVSQSLATFALGFIIWGSVFVVGSLLSDRPIFDDRDVVAWGSIIAGIAIALVGSVAFRNIRDRVTARKGTGWRPL